MENRCVIYPGKVCVLPRDAIMYIFSYVALFKHKVFSQIYGYTGTKLLKFGTPCALKTSSLQAQDSVFCRPVTDNKFFSRCNNTLAFVMGKHRTESGAW